MVNTVSDGVETRTAWGYDPHIDPVLRFDVGRSSVEVLIDDALASKDESVMREALEQLKRMQAPYLNWTGKAERIGFEVDLVSLHVHERIDPATILSAVQKRDESGQEQAPGAADSRPNCFPPRLKTCRCAMQSIFTSTTGTGPTGWLPATPCWS